jgi:lysozyme family protein
MINDMSCIKKFDLKELSQEEEMKIQGGVPWFLIGVIAGILYYITSEQ